MRASLSTALAVGCLASALAPSRTLAAEGYIEPNAVLVNIPERDLNQLLVDAFRARGGPRLEGKRSNAGRGVQDLSYQVDISDPVLKLRSGKQAYLSFDIERADLTVDRLEHKIAGRMAYCEDVGLTIDPAHPVKIGFAMGLRIGKGDLGIVPTDVSISGTEHIHFVRPSRCGNSPLPTWLLWRIGKAQLKDRIGRLGEIVSAQLARSTARMGEDEGILRRHLEVKSILDTDSQRDFYVSPRYLDTGQGSLFLSLAVSGTSGAIESPPAAARTPRGAFDGTRPALDRPYVAVSSSLLNQILDATFAGGEDTKHKVQGDYRRLLKSSSIYLIPGLREVQSKEKISFSFAFHTPPRIELQSLSADAPSAVELRLHFSGIELQVWDKREDGAALLGTLLIDSGTVGVVPMMGPLGGVSFEILENHWEVSSSGIEFNDALFSATLQELVFAEMFQTLYEPLLREGLRVGDTRFAPRGLSAVGGYLVVELAALPWEPALDARAEPPARAEAAEARSHANR